MSKKISFYLPTLEGGGAEKVAVGLANHMHSIGYKVEFVLNEKKGIYLELVNPHISIVSLQGSRVIQRIASLARYLKSNQVEALYAFMYPYSSIAVLAGMLARTQTKIIASEHTTWSKSKRRYSYKKLAAFCMRLTHPHAFKVICVSDAASKDLQKFAKLKPDYVQRIYNPFLGWIEKQQLDSACEAETAWPKSDYKLLSVGRLVEGKGFLTLLRALILVRRQLDVTLVILGEGNKREILESFIQQNNLQSYVSMPGFSNSLKKYYQQADLFTLSSTLEGLPNVIIDALTYGTSVVSTDCPSGPRELLDHGQYGKLVPVGDEDKLAEAIIASLNEKHDTQKLMEHSKKFDIGHITNQYLDLLE